MQPQFLFITSVGLLLNMAHVQTAHFKIESDELTVTINTSTQNITLTGDSALMFRDAMLPQSPRTMEPTARTTEQTEAIGPVTD